MKRTILITAMIVLAAMFAGCVEWADGEPDPDAPSVTNPVDLAFENRCEVPAGDAGEADLQCQAASFAVATALAVQAGDSVRVRFIYTTTDPLQMTWTLTSVEILDFWF